MMIQQSSRRDALTTKYNNVYLQASVLFVKVDDRKHHPAIIEISTAIQLEKLLQAAPPTLARSPERQQAIASSSALCRETSSLKCAHHR